MRIADNAELHKIMVLDQVPYADHDSEVRFRAHVILFPLSRYNDF